MAMLCLLLVVIVVENDNNGNIDIYKATFFKLEEYGNCLTLEMEEDDENLSKCSLNTTNVVIAELGFFTPKDVLLDMSAQGLTATDPSPLIVPPPSKASPTAFSGTFHILPYLIFFAHKL